jgi:hypothetical protein
MNILQYILRERYSLHDIIIQLTPHWGFSMTDYSITLTYVCYILNSLDYLSLQQLGYYFPNCVYPNPPCQLALWKETGAPDIGSF